MLTKYENGYTILLERGDAMKRSVYSLVLMDDVVEAIDELAYSLHMSRSNLINQILAEKVALVTPEQRLQRVFDQLSEYLKPYSHFQIQNQAADHMYSIKSVLRYKYNPTIRYSVYLMQQEGKFVGQLRIISRTQSEVLYYYLDAFFKLWCYVENEWFQALWEVEEGTKWLRTFQLEAFQGASKEKQLASVLSRYIKALDDGLKIYFNELGQEETQYHLLKQHYKRYYEEQGCLV